LIVALVVSIAVMLRRGHIPGTAAGPSRRIVGITVISFVAIMFTPTKWTHHFGVFAGLAGSLGALAAVAVAPAVMRSRRNRAVFAAAVLFITALSFASVNGWWYVSNFGVPWSNQMPAFKFGFATFLLGMTVLALFAAAFIHFTGRTDTAPSRRWWSRLAVSPLAVVAWVLVVFEVASLTLGMIGQYPAWSVGRSNLQALTGKTCGLADDVLVESDPNAGMLTPLDVAAAKALGSGSAEGFSPNGVPTDISTLIEPPASGNFIGLGAADSGTNTAVRVTAAAQIGRLIQNTARQPTTWMSRPPTIGPSAIAMPTTLPQIPRARARSTRSVKICEMIDRATGFIIDAPIPWTRRAAMSRPMLGARLHSSDPSAKTLRPVWKTRRRPKRSPAAPASISRDASAMV
jgi:arabinosyltransferase C